MPIFEAIMLVCFGLAWPFSIYRSWHAKSNGSKSVFFLWIILIGYVSGIIHKFYFAFDLIIWLYVLNATMVFIDILLYYRVNVLVRKNIPPKFNSEASSNETQS